MILFVYRLAEGQNLGDRVCCPADYFDFGPDVRRADITEVRKVPADARAVVLGGGGVFYFHREVAALLDGGRPVVGWGVGTNRHGGSGLDYGGVDLDRFHSLGLRDVHPGRRLVPCASCLHPAFGTDRPVRHPAVCYEHRDARGLGALGRPLMDHTGRDLSAVLDFLAGGEVVVTNTYHGWYWATLLGRPVVLYRPFSTKFGPLPWPAAVARSPAEVEALVADPGRLARYPGALAEATAANRAFHREVACSW